VRRSAFFNLVNKGYSVPSRMERFDDIAGVGLTPLDDRKDAELQHPFAHLTGCIFNIHLTVFG
jgi:hypothetical protein